MEGKRLAIVIAVLLVALVFVMAMAASGGSKDDQDSEDASCTGISIDKNDLLLIFPSGSITLKAETIPQGAGDVRWESTNESVATVDQNGKVTCRGAGVAAIKATCQDRSAVSYVTCMQSPDPLPLSDGYAQMWAVRYLAQYPFSEKMLGLLLERYGFSEESTAHALTTCGPGYGVPDWDAQAESACRIAEATGLYDSAGAKAWLKGEGFTEDQAQRAVDKVYGRRLGDLIPSAHYIKANPTRHAAGFHSPVCGALGLYIYRNRSGKSALRWKRADGPWPG